MQYYNKISFYLKKVFHSYKSWYRKPSNTLNFTNWNSFGPKTHKINTVKATIKRLKVICSDELTLKNDLEELRMSFIGSNYPINLLNRLFSEKLERRKIIFGSSKNNLLWNKVL